MTKFTFYRDKRKEWRWRAWRAGQIIAESGEAYALGEHVQVSDSRQ